MPLARGTRLGPYEVLAPLGAGGMGEVWRAHDTKLARDVALKVLPDHLSDDPKALARFENEAKAVAALSHPHILAIHDFGRIDGVSFVVTELLEGETLRAALLRGPLSLRKVLDVASQLADALAAAHEKEIVHRDVKPENVILTKDGRAKLLDFGLARHDAAFRSSDDTHSPTVSRNTDPGTILGTVSYMSPEQAQGHPAGYRSDQFSLGVVLYEMLAGKRPFHGPSSAETLAAIIRAEPEPFGATVPAPVRWILDRLLAKDPADRYDSTRDLARELANVRTHVSEATTLAENGAGRFTGSRRLRVAAAALAVATGAGVAGALVGRLASEKPAPSFQRLTFRRGHVTGARFAPGGEGVVYSAAWDGAPSRVFAVDLDSRESRPAALPGARLLAVSATGELALGLGDGLRCFVSARAASPLAVVPLSGGTPRPVEQDVLFADWSADGTAMATVRRAGRLWHLEYPAGKVLARSPALMTDVRVSPRGDAVAFLEHPFGGDVNGHVVVVDRSGAQRLTRTYHYAAGLAWSAAGDEVWFTASVMGERKKLRAVTLAGRERVVYGDTGALVLHDVARDGRVLLAREDFRRRIFFRDVGSGEAREVSWQDRPRLFDLTADGRRFAFWESGEGASRGATRFYLRETSGEAPVRLETGGRGLIFSPDGRWVVTTTSGSEAATAHVYPVEGGRVRTVELRGFRTCLAGLMPDAKGLWVGDVTEGRPQRTWLLAGESSPARPVTPEGVAARYPWVTRDGTAVVGSSGPSLALYPVAGGEPVPLLGVGAGERLAGWGPSADSVYAHDPTDIPTTVYRVDLATGARSTVYRVGPTDLAGVRNVEVFVTPDGLRYAFEVHEVQQEIHVANGLR